MELIIKESNPARWERLRLRKGEDKEGDGEEEVRPGGENPPEPSAAADGEEDAVYSDGEAGIEGLFGYNGPESASALRSPGSQSRSADAESLFFRGKIGKPRGEEHRINQLIAQLRG